MSRSIELLVDEQVRRWIAEREIADRASSYPPESTGTPERRQRPVICISRECGALGGRIGRLVAERLGFGFYAQELVDQIAKQAHVRRKVVESLDERRRRGVARWIDELVQIGRFTPSDYMNNLSELVLTLGRHGKSVIVGRGAFLLLDRHETLRVRFHAPLDWRIDQMAKNWNMPRADARATVIRIDAERVDFYRETFDIDVRDKEHFDLLVDTSTTTEEASTDVVVRAFQARFGAPKSETKLRAVDADAGMSSARPEVHSS
jgi:cytidylate kinase